MDKGKEEKEKVTVSEYKERNGSRQQQQGKAQADEKARQQAEAKRQALIAGIEQYDQVLDYLIWVIAAVFLNRHVTQIMREQLVRSLYPEQYEGCPPLPDTRCMRLFANLLLLYSLSYYYCLAYQNNETNPSCTGQRDSWASLLVLAATFLRFVNIITGPVQQTLQEEEDDTEGPGL